MRYSNIVPLHEISAPPFDIYIPDDITTAQAQAAIAKAVVK